MAAPRILIVDDEIIIARDLEARLRKLGYDVPAIASSGPEAIRMAEETHPDLALMDIVLKGDMDGVEAAAEILRRWRLPVIYLTAYTDPETLERARITEPYGYIIKPFSERELHANIQMALYRHQAERRLRRIERFFTSAVEEMADAVVGANDSETVTLVNPAAEAITGWSREEALGRDLTEVLHIVRRDTMAPIPLAAGARSGPLVCLADETLLVSREGRLVPVDATTSCIRDSQDRPVGTLSVLRDRSIERHGPIAKLSADVAFATAQGSTRRAMLQMCAESLVRNLGAAFARIWTVNMAGNLLLLDASAGMYTHLNGRHGRIPIGQSKVGKVAQSKVPQLTNALQQDPDVSDREWATREGMVAFAGYPLLVGDRLVGVMAMFARRPLEEGVISALASVANSIAVGIERGRLEEQVNRARRMEAVGQLAGGVAHDFNNLLTVISGSAGLLLEARVLEGRHLRLLEQIARAGERGAGLTRQLLAFSRKQVREPRPLWLNSLVADTERLLHRVLGENVDLSTDLAPDLPATIADHGQMEQVLVNLAVNARDAMPSGGRLTIGTRALHVGSAQVLSNGSLPPGDYVAVVVSDTGAGIPPEVQERMFEPFFTTKGPGRGTGLGLATVYNIVEQSGGVINFYSQVGSGTTFEVFLRAAPEAQSPAPTQERAAAPARGTETILLVEDDPAVRRLNREMLESYGYRVLAADRPSEALRLLATVGHPIQLLVTDVVMPEMSGRQLAEQVVARRDDCRVLYVSGYAPDAIVQHGVLHAEVAFLAKPFTSRMLAEKVREALDAPQR